MVDAKQIKTLLLNHFNIRGDITINPTSGIVDVDGIVDMKEDQGFTEIPVTFGKVTQSFYCTYNRLSSLKGAPQVVGDEFLCHNNRLVTLEGAPQVVSGNFHCHANQLNDLNGAPQIVNGGFWCYNNPFTTLDGFPKHVGGTVSLSYHSNLPLLRTLNARAIRLKYIDDGNYTIVNDVLNRHANTGRRGAISAARELINSGEVLKSYHKLNHNPFESNARW